MRCDWRPIQPSSRRRFSQKRDILWFTKLYAALGESREEVCEVDVGCRAGRLGFIKLTSSDEQSDEVSSFDVVAYRLARIEGMRRARLTMFKYSRNLGDKL